MSYVAPEDAQAVIDVAVFNIGAPHLSWPWTAL